MKPTQPSSPKFNRRTLLKSGAAVLTTSALASTVPRTVVAQGGGIKKAMRSPENRRVVSATAAPPLPPLSTIALNRMGFGPRPGDVDAFNALGGNDDARLAAYVAQQLNPDSIDDSVFESRVAAAGFQTLNKSLTQLWADHIAADPDYSYRMLPIKEVEVMAFNRAIHSKRQLLEVLADFWHNHFNVYGWDYEIGPVFVHYDRDVIRAHALGNFRQMLEAVAKSPAMLVYLNNRTNSGGNPNENFARELFELHTMGAENYMGVMHQSSVPRDGNGKPVAYVDEDVYGATTCFTGWRINETTGEFFYDSTMHFNYQKVVFGEIIPPDQPPEKDGKDVLDMLIAHPGTGRYIARKLCRRFISDTPPDDLVNAAGAVFTAQRDAPDQLKQVLEVILLSDAFKSTWGEKIKRPFEFAVSVLRALDADHFFTVEGEPTDDFFWLYQAMGQELFYMHVPTGYPDEKEDWTGSGSILFRWRLANWLVDDSKDMGATNEYWADVVSQTPSNVRSPNALVDFWIHRLLGRSIDSASRQIVVDFMAQGRNPNFDLPLDTDEDVQERLRSMVGLIFNSPDFQWR